MNSTLPLPSVAKIAPTATQAGIVSTCVSWYRADSGDTCELIVEIFSTFSAENFLQWNPAVLSDCSSLTPALGGDCLGLTQDYYICVGMPDDSITSATASTTTSGTTGGITGTITPSTTTSSVASVTTLVSGITTPSPAQAGMVSGCERFYWVESGDGCYNIAAAAGISLDSFYTYNPAVNTDCSGLQASVYVCISLSGPATTITTGTPIPASATTTEPGALGTPTPIQAGMVSGCERFYYVESGDGCYNLASEAGIALA
ncbi:hypothetical protein VE03_07916 [Pseudogymnoascus sp. 23342-1-I1]|nr:hypothetical protein VE03_07916 [Pseudogymnoascus sp. 23342-1-I1]